MTALRFLTSQRSRRRIDWLFRFRNQITSLLLVDARALRANRGRADRTPTSRSTASDAALTPCPANLLRRRTREPSLSIRWEARHGLCRSLGRGDAGHGLGTQEVILFQRADACSTKSLRSRIR